MNKLIFIVVIVALTAAAAIGQEKKLSSAPASFRTFFATFKRAVVRGEKQKVAGFTRFPFKAAIDAGDEDNLTKSQFLKLFRNVFGDDAREYWTDEYLTFSRGDRGTYNVLNSSNASIMEFVKAKNTYRFTAFYALP